MSEESFESRRDRLLERVSQHLSPWDLKVIQEMEMACYTDGFQDGSEATLEAIEDSKADVAIAETMARHKETLEIRDELRKCFPENKEP